MNKFEYGDLVVTKSISDYLENDVHFTFELAHIFTRYRAGDFSDMEYVEDVQMNFDAIKSGKDRIFATYNTSKGKIYIITEWDRSVTTILFPHEY